MTSSGNQASAQQANFVKDILPVDFQFTENKSTLTKPVVI